MQHLITHTHNMNTHNCKYCKQFIGPNAHTLPTGCNYCTRLAKYLIKLPTEHDSLDFFDFAREKLEEILDSGNYNDDIHHLLHTADLAIQDLDAFYMRD